MSATATSIRDNLVRIMGITPERILVEPEAGADNFKISFLDDGSGGTAARLAARFTDMTITQLGGTVTGRASHEA